jgi:hypothetical protein
MILRISVRQLVGALILSAFSFLLGFTFSKFLVDLSLREAEELLTRSTRDFDRQQVAIMRQFGIDYELLQRKVDAISPLTQKER